VRNPIEQVEKLLRLAGPKSGTTEHERASAALEAARLIEEHDLVVRERKRSPKKRAEPKTERAWSGSEPHQRREPTPTASAPPPGWTKSIARTDSTCCDPDCGEPIAGGESVWMRIRGYEIEYLHADGPCGW
jgi:hypothetical protein